jgi:hypothetical protein
MRSLIHIVKQLFMKIVIVIAVFHVRSTEMTAHQRVIDARYASLVSVAQRVHVNA